jgi:hypothetical protein
MYGSVMTELGGECIGTADAGVGTADALHLRY